MFNLTNITNSTFIELCLVASLGFLGSFGHCAGMCGPLAISFSLSSQTRSPEKRSLNNFQFHLLLNLGRIFSYATVGVGLGSFGSILFKANLVQLQQVMTVCLGLLLIWLGLIRIAPDLLPKLPIAHPLQGKLHDRLSTAMAKVAVKNYWFTPIIVGIFWGLIPCGFLYIAQIKAAETGNIILGSLTMLAFGLGTIPTMVGVGVSVSRVSSDRKSQLFRLGGWITLIIGVLTLLRTSTMTDYTGHGALLLLILALIARPISSYWSTLLKYRRAIGVGAYILAIVHTIHMLDHSFNWNLQSIPFMIPQHRFGLAMGIASFLLITPAAFTSNDLAVTVLGSLWRKIHLLSVIALIFAAIHTIFLGSHYLGQIDLNWSYKIRAIFLVVIVLGVLGIRFRKRA